MGAVSSPRPEQLPGRLCARDIVRMQRLSQRVVALRPELVNPDASFGELAWIWGKDHRALGDSWRHRLWFAGSDSDNEPEAWGWARLPHQLQRSDGSVSTVDHALLTFQVHPEQPALLDEVTQKIEKS